MAKERPAQTSRELPIRDDAQNKPPRRDRHRDRSVSEAPRREIKQEIHPGQSKERNVREAIEPSPETRVGAQPAFFVEVQPKEEADRKAEHNPQPRKDEIKVSGVEVHSRIH